MILLPFIFKTMAVFSTALPDFPGRSEDFLKQRCFPSSRVFFSQAGLALSCRNDAELDRVWLSARKCLHAKKECFFARRQETPNKIANTCYSHMAQLNLMECFNGSNGQRQVCGSVRAGGHQPAPALCLLHWKCICFAQKQGVDATQGTGPYWPVGSPA